MDGKLVDIKQNAFTSHVVIASSEEKTKAQDGSNNSEILRVYSEKIVPVKGQGILFARASR